MPAAIPLADHLSPAEISVHFKACTDTKEKLRWQVLLLKAKGYSHGEIADITPRSRKWVTLTIQKYNKEGPTGLIDKRSGNGASLLLDEPGQQALREAVSGPPPSGGLWTGKKVRAWLKNRLNRDVNLSTAYDDLHRRKLSWQVPRPQERRSDKAGQEVVKKGV